ncbi:AAA family ATPase, partial [Streptomyces sp. NPDC004667]|uniref:AAA family ATPase n=1 Tax=Streptomyces sp. NPDC004667 TaxID=3154285 RepID=UPI0033A324D1
MQTAFPPSARGERGPARAALGAGPTMPGAAGRTPLPAGRTHEPAGRSGELAALFACAEAADAGRAGCVVVRGNTGIGKTALIDGFRRDDRLRGATVLHTAGRAERATTAYGAVRELFGPGAEAERVPPRTEWLASTLMARGPLVIVVDDAQWCDGPSLRWLESLIRRTESARLLTVLAWGASGTGPARSALGRIVQHPGTRLVGLGPVAEEQVAETVERVLGQPPEPPFTWRCAALSDGNPLLLKRILLRLRRAGVTPRARSVGRVDAAWREVHTASVRAHLRGLTETERRVVRAAAVLDWSDRPPSATAEGTGRVASPERVGALAGVRPRLVSTLLDGHRDDELVSVDGEEAFHAAVLAATPAGELARLRTRAARLLNDEGFASAEVAKHLLPLPRLDEGWMLGALRDAAEQAGRTGPRSAAAPYLRRLMEAEPEEHGRVRTALDMAGALATTHPADALDALRSLLDQTRDVRLRASVAVQFAMTALATGDAEAALAVLSRTLDRPPAEPGGRAEDRALRGTIELARLAAGLHLPSAFPAVRERARAAVSREGAAPAGSGGLLARALLAVVEGDSAHEAVDLVGRAVRAEGAGPRDWTRARAAQVLHLADEPGMALEMLDLALADDSGCLPRWSLLAERSMVRHRLGDVPGAALDADAALEAVEHPGQGGSALPFVAWGSVRLEQGDTEAAESMLDRVSAGRLDHTLLGRIPYLMTRARIRLGRGDAEGALACARRCERGLAEAGLDRRPWAPWRPLAATALVRLGRTPEAAELAAEARELADRWGTPYAIGHALLAACTAAEGDRRTEFLTGAVEALSRSQARLDRARAELLLGGHLARRGDAAGARRHLGRAHETARRCGSPALTAEVRAALAAA